MSSRSTFAASAPRRQVPFLSPSWIPTRSPSRSTLFKICSSLSLEFCCLPSSFCFSPKHSSHFEMLIMKLLLNSLLILRLVLPGLSLYSNVNSVRAGLCLPSSVRTRSPAVGEQRSQHKGGSEEKDKRPHHGPHFTAQGGGRAGRTGEGSQEWPGALGHCVGSLGELPWLLGSKARAQPSRFRPPELGGRWKVTRSGGTPPQTHPRTDRLSLKANQQ